MAETQLLSERFDRIFTDPLGVLNPSISPGRPLVHDRPATPGRADAAAYRLTIGLDIHNQPRILSERLAGDTDQGSIVIRSLATLVLQGRLLSPAETEQNPTPGVTVEVNGDATVRRRYTLPDGGNATMQIWEESEQGEGSGQFGAHQQLSEHQLASVIRMTQIIMAEAEQLAAA